MQSHILEDLNPEQLHRESVVSCSLFLVWAVCVCVCVCGVQ
jgi:hypothetical protein